MRRYSGSGLRPALNRASGRQGSGASVRPLAPDAVSQAITAAYSLRRISTAYTGPCLQVRDSGNALRTVGFDAAGNLDITGFAGWGDGVTFTVAQWYDQSGRGHDVSSTFRPRLIFPHAPQDYSGAYVDFQTKGWFLASATTPLAVGGTANLSLFAVAATLGWTSAGTHPRNPAAYAGARGPLVGYGTSAGGGLLYGADGPDAETTLYGKTGELLVDASHDFAQRWRNIWFNQRGALVSGGGDRRVLFNHRPHGHVASSDQRIVIGNNGALNQSANGALRELILFNSAGALSDAECAGIAAWQNRHWQPLARNRFPQRFVVIFAGQSNAQYYGVDNASGDGTAGSNALERVFLPDLRARLAIPADSTRELHAYCNSTAYGGSPVLHRVDPAKAWWDGDAEAPGPSLANWLTSIDYGGAPGKAYRRCAIIWSQGEAEALYWAANPGDSALPAEWRAQTKLVWQAMRDKIGYACPIVIQPLGNQAGAQPQMDALRTIQAELASEVPNVTLGPDTRDLAMQDLVHFAPFTHSAQGYDLGAERLSQTLAPILLAIK